MTDKSFKQAVALFLGVTAFLGLCGAVTLLAVVLVFIQPSLSSQEVNEQVKMCWLRKGTAYLMKDGEGDVIAVSCRLSDKRV